MPKRNDLLQPTWDSRCGTESGAKAHSIRGERACAMCNKARSTAERERYRKKSFRTGLHNCPSCGTWMKAIDHGVVECSGCGRVDHV